jgi:hypothetical protein
LPTLVIILLLLPVIYYAISYIYVAKWHGRIILWNVLIHENGRLTLKESLFFFDHFISAMPKVIFYAFFIACGFSLDGSIPAGIKASRSGFIALLLFAGAGFFVLLAFILSISKVGWRRTTDCLLQRVERDEVESKGGSWNQLQVSNIPLYLMMFSASFFMNSFTGDSNPAEYTLLKTGTLICVVAGVLLWIIPSIYFWPGWRAFMNPRWTAHGIREIATQPFILLPTALFVILLIHQELTDSYYSTWYLKIPFLSIFLFIIGTLIVIGQLILLRKHSIHEMAQKPEFAPDGLPLSYLLCAHSFEHFLDLVFIALFTGGIYSLSIWLSLTLN